MQSGQVCRLCLSVLQELAKTPAATPASRMLPASEWGKLELDEPVTHSGTQVSARHKAAHGEL